jgi:hypothetical protein
MTVLLRIIRLDAKRCRDVGIFRGPASVLKQMLYQLNKTGHKSQSAVFVSELHFNTRTFRYGVSTHTYRVIITLFLFFCVTALCLLSCVLMCVCRFRNYPCGVKHPL